MDVVCQGGYAAARRLLKEIDRAGLKFAFHSWGTALEVIAAAHLGVCWPEQVIEWLEYPCYAAPSRAGMYPFPLAEEILKQPLRMEHGDLIMPAGPAWEWKWMKKSCAAIPGFRARGPSSRSIPRAKPAP